MALPADDALRVCIDVEWSATDKADCRDAQFFRKFQRKLGRGRFRKHNFTTDFRDFQQNFRRDAPAEDDDFVSYADVIH